MRFITNEECAKVVRHCLAGGYGIEDLYWVLPDVFNIFPDGEDAEVIAAMLSDAWDEIEEHPEDAQKIFDALGKVEE